MSQAETPGRAILGREALELHELAVGELPAHLVVEQHDAVAHVVEHGLHDLARALDIVARRVRFRARPLGASRAASAASLAAASASSRSFSSVMSR